MKNTLPLNLIKSALVLSLVSAPVLASDDDRKSGLDAHEHGAAQMLVAKEGNLLVIEFESPAFNMLGFEHLPSTDEQKAERDRVVSVLNNWQSVISLPEAGQCKNVATNVEWTAEEDSDGHGHDEHKDDDGHDHDEHKDDDGHDHDEHKDDDGHDHDEHKDDDGHDHDEHKDDDGHDHDEHKDEDGHDHDEHKDEDGHDHDEHKDEDGHDHDEHDHEGEGETHSEFHIVYEFECSGPVDQITLNAFDQFSQLESVSGAFIHEGGQGGATLDAGNSTLEL